MFINAEPRVVSNSFETFVPIHRAEVLHERLIEMTNNNVNAWSIFRPEAAAENWEHNLDEYSNNENFQVQSLYGDYFQDSSLAAQSQSVNFPRTVTYAPAHQTQCQSSKNVPTFQQIYQDSAPYMNCYRRPSPMLGNDYPQLSLGRGRGSFAEFSNVRNALKDSSYHLQPETTESSYNSQSSTVSVPQLYYAEEATTMRDPMSMASTSPNTVYSSDSSPQTSVNHRRSSRCADTQHSNFPGTNSQCWQGHFQGGGESQVAYEVPINNDGLPKYAPTTFYNPWSVNTTSTGNWASCSLASNTISPKMLRLNVSDTSLSSSDSGKGSVMGLSDSSAAISLRNDPGECSSPEAPPAVEPQQPASRPRHILPDSVPLSRRVVPVVPSNDYDPSRNSKKRSMKVSKPQNNSRRKSSPRVRHTATPAPSPSPKEFGSGSELSRAPAKTKGTEPKPIQPATLSQSAAAVLPTHHRDAKDEFLIRSKMAGMSYKDIRQQGKFTETESTLRGRFRTLTKHKTARVRRPEWSEKDIRLLRKAVRELSQNLDTSKSKIPWKLVAEYIADHGGSYHFGYATCRKRWDELQNEDSENE
ncbi:hypothetical protein PZA11_002143 [Diplocarpon coronariae]